MNQYNCLSGNILARIQDPSSGGIGIRWEELDEDLSIKGFIKTSALNAILRELQGRENDEKSVA